MEPEVLQMVPVVQQLQGYLDALLGLSKAASKQDIKGENVHHLPVNGTSPCENDGQLSRHPSWQSAEQLWVCGLTSVGTFPTCLSLVGFCTCMAEVPS